MEILIPFDLTINHAINIRLQLLEMINKIIILILAFSSIFSCKESCKPFQKNNINIVLENVNYEIDFQNRLFRAITAFDSIMVQFDLTDADISEINKMYFQSAIFKMPDTLILGNKSYQLPKNSVVLNIQNGNKSRYYEVDLDDKFNDNSNGDKEIIDFIDKISTIVLKKKEIKELEKPQVILCKRICL